MANPTRAATIRFDRAAMEADPGPQITHYNMPLDYPRLYEWIPGDTTTSDGLAVLTHSGGTIGRWHLIRGDIQGVNLTDADETLVVGGNFFRVLPAAVPLTVNRVKTLATTNAAVGDEIHINRIGLGAFTLAIANGGAGAGTIYTLPAGQSWWAKAYFNGTDWVAHSAGQNP